MIPQPLDIVFSFNFISFLLSLSFFLKISIIKYQNSNYYIYIKVNKSNIKNWNSNMEAKYYYSAEWTDVSAIVNCEKLFARKQYEFRDNKRSVHFFSGLQNQKLNWQTPPVATSANQTRRISIARIDFSSITEKILSEMNVFAISRKSFSIVEFDSTGLRRLRKYFANRIKKCKRFVIRAISTRLLSFGIYSKLWW